MDIKGWAVLKWSHLFLVLFIWLSKGTSNIWLIVLAAALAIAVPIVAHTAVWKLKTPGAMAYPAVAVIHTNRVNLAWKQIENLKISLWDKILSFAGQKFDMKWQNLSSRLILFTQKFFLLLIHPVSPFNDKNPDIFLALCEKFSIYGGNFIFKEGEEQICQETNKSLQIQVFYYLPWTTSNIDLYLHSRTTSGPRSRLRESLL